MVAHPRLPSVVMGLALLAAACGGAPRGPSSEAPPAPPAERVADFDRMPSGVAVYGDRVFVSFPRWVEPGDATVVELVDGTAVPYPDAAMNDPSSGPAALHSVNGLHVDSRGWLWILDNGRVDLGPASAGVPKLVVWDTVAEREVFRHAFDVAIAPPDASFLNDIVVDEVHGFAYLTQSGMGGPPSLVVFEIHRDLASRALDGHVSVVADPGRDMVIDGETVVLHRSQGPVPWRVAANSIALLPGGDTLLFGPMSSDTLYAVPTVALRDPTLDGAARTEAVVVWGPKPVSDGICADAAGRIFATDVEHSAIVELHAEGFGNVASDPRFSFPVAVEAPGDGTIWFTTNQLHRSPLVLGGVDARVPPYTLWRAPVPEDAVGP